MTEPRTTVTREAERGIRYGLLAVLVVGLRRRDPGAVVNAVVALAVTYLPGVVERRYDVEFRPWQRVYAQGAMLTHALGMLGPYDDVWWWDHVTHTHSATLVGGLVHAVARRNDRDPRPRVLAAVVGGGVLWELVEYVVHHTADRLGIEPVLVSYGKVDTALDLVFNALGALVVLAWGDRLLGNFVDAPSEPSTRAVSDVDQDRPT
ncbi:hypothetical protein BRC81_03230 [Halobacteriales archaeon QS_1_68_20]|nr:MAG: hypothetical protein BRC81_03230 [Halobacteriales archaeon QS_1_68_20]